MLWACSAVGASGPVTTVISAGRNFVVDDVVLLFAVRVLTISAALWPNGGLSFIDVIDDLPRSACGHLVV